MKDSITHWLVALRQGSEEAACNLWGRYYARIVRLVRHHLHGVGVPLSSPIDDENTALEAFHLFCAAHQDGRFPDLSSRRQLWPLLVTITLNRTRDEVRALSAQKRGSGRQVLLESQLESHSESSGEVGRLDQVPASGPLPDQVAIMADECRALLESLHDPELEQVALWKLDGLTDDEVAGQLGYSRRTIQRMLHLIRITWEGYLERRTRASMA
jgi:DNA-directed RNA polymerase specialized sigma24 family protein